MKAGRLDGIDADKCGYLGPRGDWSEKRFRVLTGPDSWNSYGLVRCPGCKTWVLPYWARRIDPSYLVWKIKRAIERARFE